MADSDKQPAIGSEGPRPGLIARFMTEMNMSQRLAYLGAVALLVGGFIALMLWVNQPDYQVLYSGLSQQDASAVVTKLKELKVPYQLDAGGQTIRVPSESVYDTRLSLAGAGLPRGQGVGFEVFNEVKMGTTEFVQKINYQRALQGELARTISSFGAVDAARVHIVMPRDSLFVEEEKKPSAGVVLRLAAGRALSQSQIQGIVHLVASSVPDLDENHISVVDTRGNLLFRKAKDTEDFPSALTASQLEYQRNVESRLRQKVESMLEEVLGAGKSSVRVSADIDFTRTSSVQQIFDPDRVAVRSETRSSDTSRNAGAAPGGSPDQRFALAARNATPNKTGGEGSSTERENETTNFEISTTRTQTMRPVGGLKRLSVAVVVDGTYKQPPEGAEGEAAKPTYVARGADEMRQITALVRRAVGIDDKRGDVVTVENMPRHIVASEAGMVGLPWWREYIKEYGRTALNIVLGLLFFFMVVRPLLRYITSRAPRGGSALGEARRVGHGEELPAGERERRELLEEEAKPAKLGVRDQIRSLAAQDPERATSVLQAWIHES